MEENNKVLSDIVIFNKYARYNSQLKRRETWDEIIDRYINMMIRKYPKLKDDINFHSSFLYRKQVLPSMRAAQFSGPAIIKNESRIYNCSYLPVDDYRAFSEIMFLLLGGTGVGYSVQYHHINKLPDIQKPTKEAKYLIGDSIEGWADAVKQLMKAYFGIIKTKPRFDYSDIREKGELLITAGGKAPGPEPLRICLTKIESLLNQRENGSKLSSLDVHDICCFIADAVLAGGIRRAALISLFSFDDKLMATAKHGQWWELNPQRGRANNSAVILRNRVKEEEFKQFWQLIKDSKSGEPGIYFTNDPDYGTNPCCEISLRPFTFCNLVEINGGLINSQEELNQASHVGAFFATLQAGFTDFHYLRPIWKHNTEKDALIGVGITGIGNGTLEDLNLSESAQIVKIVNKMYANKIGINPAARTTTIKPSGTTSCVVGTSSGIHAWHSKYYIRNMQCKVGDDLYNHFKENYPLLIKTMDYDPSSAVIGIPQKAPDTAILRENETALQLLSRVNKYNINWVREGHNRGPNTNNVSATISIKDHTNDYPMRILSMFGSEWDLVGKWMWDNKDNYNGLSVLPYDGGTYKDAPFQECTKEKYDELIQYITENNIDLTKIIEDQDHTTQSAELACAGGSCDVTIY
jgi:ribonucleoside-triphosphate reductase